MEREKNPPRDEEIADSVIADLIPRFRGRTVLVLGDVMLDRYVSGEVSRISSEAPIPVLQVTGFIQVWAVLPMLRTISQHWVRAPFLSA
jgi:hypothetical protein